MFRGCSSQRTLFFHPGLEALQDRLRVVGKKCLITALLRPDNRMYLHTCTYTKIQYSLSPRQPVTTNPTLTPMLLQHSTPFHEWNRLSPRSLTTETSLRQLSGTKDWEKSPGKMVNMVKMVQILQVSSANTWSSEQLNWTYIHKLFSQWPSYFIRHSFVIQYISHFSHYIWIFSLTETMMAMMSS